jgi:hypothetical protein
MAANGCRAALGVNINYTIMVRYPTKVWDALLKIDKLWPLPPAVPIIDQVQTVVNGTTLDAANPVFSVATLICKDYEKGDKATCGARNQNISNMLIQTGTNVELEIKTIEGSSKGPDGGSEDPPGLAFQMSSTFSILSSVASGLCKGMKPFCCAEPLQEAGCCCTDSEMSAQCTTGRAPFTSNMCSAATGRNEVCADHMDDPSKPENGKLKAQKSDCEIFKKGIYNFTTGKTGVGGRINVFPDSEVGVSLATVHPELFGQLNPQRRALAEEADEEGKGGKGSVKAVATLAGDEREGFGGESLGSDLGAGAGTGTESFDLLQYVYAELCSTTLGNRHDTRDCPGCSHGSCWLSGDAAGDDGKGYVKIGKFDTCDSLGNKLLRAVGWWGVVGIILLIVAIVAAGGFGAFKAYKKKQEQQAYGVSVNDDSIYKDVVSDAADAALAGTESDSVVR